MRQRRKGHKGRKKTRLQLRARQASTSLPCRTLPRLLPPPPPTLNLLLIQTARSLLLLLLHLQRMVLNSHRKRDAIRFLFLLRLLSTIPWLCPTIPHRDTSRCTFRFPTSNSDRAAKCLSSPPEASLSRSLSRRTSRPERSFPSRYPLCRCT